ncbi:putative methyltransferase DDB_G0268948 [Spea bombifrons]|uniref:putative methyltransferase DDB_G0268948 n=1 Tax=Spea bombifrons TaxID=233779 RepID=UPI00234B39D5|nr:putative methyltransferase DDB_G0268948 [Spea bombifrons]
MAVEMFKNKEFSSAYEKYMLPVANEVITLILSYIEKKTKPKPYEMAVDIGCGTGRYTLPLAPHFHKVLGVDISQSQIDEARRSSSFENVTYQVSPAENLPLEDASVDLVTVGLAVHWFDLDRFMLEVVRVLKPKGCLAVHAFYPVFRVEYKGYSEALTGIMKEMMDTISKYSDKSDAFLLSQYKDIFNAVPLEDKKWVTDIPVVFERSVKELIGFIQSIYMYQDFLTKDQDGATRFLKYMEQRFHDVLGEETDSATMKVQVKHYCVLACKS